jgi:hypothetical protein
MAPERVAQKIMGSDELKSVLSDTVAEYYKVTDIKVCFSLLLVSL